MQIKRPIPAHKPTGRQYILSLHRVKNTVQQFAVPRSYHLIYLSHLIHLYCLIWYFTVVPSLPGQLNWPALALVPPRHHCNPEYTADNLEGGDLHRLSWAR